MKITYLHQYFTTPKGSWSTRAYELSKRWVDAGHEVTVITAPYDKSDIKANGLLDIQYFDGIKVVVINSGDSNRKSTWKRVCLALKFSIISTFYINKINSDVIVASSGPITIGIPGLIEKWIKGTKFVFEIRDLWPDGGIEMGLIKGRSLIKLTRVFEKLIYNHSNFIVTASDGQKRVLIDNGESPDKIGIIYNASDNELFGNNKSLSNEQCDLLNGRDYFLYFGSMGFIHNVSYIIKSAVYLKCCNSPILIIIIGDGIERLELEKKVIDLNLENVIFLGQLKKIDIVPWLSNCVATLFCTLNFPVQNTCSPNKIFDSFAASKPVIQTTEGWIKELFVRYECGVNVHPEQPEEMAKAMIDYTSDQDKLLSHGLNAKKLAISKFDRDLLALMYLNILNEI